MTRVGIVCDSTCDLGPQWLGNHGVRMVPLKVLFGTDSYLDWTDMSPDEFYVKLAAYPVLPKTSQPSPADFATAYAQLAEEGCTEIVSIHLTSALSGTFESATLAAVDAPVPIRIVDTKTVSMATALAIKAAIEARDGGGSASEVEEAARTAAETSRLYFILDTLEYLVKGGRAGKAAGLAASVLNIKPVLTFTPEGTIEPFKKVKGLKKALAELAAQVAADSAGSTVRLSVLHGSAPELANQMVSALDAAGVDYELDMIGSVGAVIGTYAGPGAVGLAYYPIS
ncbi:MAG: DegV family protein [Anaerosomatales bacterium]|nr:DegV family protein [Anaerosomatales bacterium]MDT8433426.1 DegV family protein [Anaerosomatales bacterium]